MQKLSPVGLDVRALDVGHLAFFAGSRLNELVLEQLRAEGHPRIRNAHGYVFQHLIAGPLAVTAVAALLSVSQQAASKQLAELQRLGYVKRVVSKDGRKRMVALTERAHDCIELARRIRIRVERPILRKFGSAAVDKLRRQLAEMLEMLGGVEAIQQRRVARHD